MGPRILSPGTNGLAAVLALAAVWVVMHPFRGLHHDGVLYAAQALLHLEHERLASDIFFAFGSQDDFTLFGRLYSALISGVGLIWGPRTLYVLAHAFAFVTTLAWLDRALPAHSRLLAATIVMAAPSVYGSEAMFRVGEPFVTARLIAEPIVLLALLACLRGGRPVVTGALLACAGLLHPLVALPGVLACGGLVLFRLEPGVRWKWLIVLGVAGLLLAASVVLGAWPQVGEHWHGLLVEFRAIALPATWGPADWVRQLFPALALGLLAQRDTAEWRLLWRVIAGVALGGTLLASFAEFTRWELGMQVQFWRFAWLAAWALPIAAVRVAFDASGSARVWRGLALGVLPALALAAQSWWPPGWLLPLASLGALAVRVLAGFPEGRVARRLVVAILALVIGFAVMGGATALFVALALGGPERMRSLALSAVIADYLGWVLCPLGVWLLLRLCKAFERLRFTAAGVALVLASSLFADGRSMEVRVLDRLIEEGAPWSGHIAGTATVFWPGRLGYVWFGLRRNSYLSTSQVPGILFSESKTVELARRFREVGPVGQVERDVFENWGRPRAEPPPPTHADLARACADPILDYVVLDVSLAPVIGEPWLEPDTGRRFHLHRCADHRTSVTPAVGAGASPG